MAAGLVLMLERLIEYINGHQGIRWQTMAEIVDDYRVSHPFSDVAPAS